MMETVVLHYSELDRDTLYDILQLRMSVFVAEQGCAYMDIDGRDRDAYHLICRDKGEIKGYLRILRPGTFFKEASIGRVIAVDRGKGIATEMVSSAIGFIRDVLHENRIRIESQVYAAGLYEKLGFVKEGEEFLEDGIPHIQMVYGC